MFGHGSRILETRAPDLLQQLLTAEDPAGVTGEEGKQLVLTRCQINTLARNRDFTRTQVNGDVAIHERVVPVPGALRRRLHRTPAQPCPHACDEFPKRVRLDHIVVRAEFQADDTVDLLGPSGQHDHRYFAGLSQPAQDGKSVHPRHRDVEHDEVDLGGLEKLERGLSVCRLQHSIPEPFKAAGKRNSRSFVILGDE